MARLHYNRKTRPYARRSSIPPVKRGGGFVPSDSTLFITNVITRRASRPSVQTRLSAAVILTAIAFFASFGISFGAVQGIDASISPEPSPNAPASQESSFEGQNSANQAKSRDAKEATDRSELQKSSLVLDPKGVQHRFPAVVKIVGRAETKTREDGVATTPYFYGTGCYVSELSDWGVIVTNWHVVSESTESLEAIFPGRNPVPCRVVLRDEFWDLAALVIVKPVDVQPLPISFEFQKVGTRLWVGGYGQTGDLNDFRMTSGRLNTYVTLVDPSKAGVDEDDFEAIQRLRPEQSALYETLSIGCGVRHGDSGGPIFNQYGELAGLLWGSDSKNTMGTSGYRLQVFLTQAIRQAAKQRARCVAQGRDPKNTSVWPLEIDLSVNAEGGMLPMDKALDQYKAFPISGEPVYQSPDGVIQAENLMNLSARDAKKVVVAAAVKLIKAQKEPLPPSRPIFSPSFIAQQRVLAKVRPDARPLILETLCANWEKKELERVQAEERAAIVRNKAQNARAREVAENSPSEIQTENVDGAAFSAQETLLAKVDSPTKGVQSAQQSTHQADAVMTEASMGSSENAATLTETSVPVGQSHFEPEQNADASKPSEQSATSNRQNNVLAQEAPTPSARESKNFSNIEIYILSCVLFLFFYCSASLIEKENKRARKKKRLMKREKTSLRNPR